MKIIKKIENNDIFLAQNGCSNSIEKIIEKYQYYIIKISQKFFLQDGDKDDLIQEGNIGLLKAIKYYNEKKNIKFITFAILCIKNQIVTAIRRSNAKKYMILNNSIDLNSKTIETNSKYLYIHKELACPEKKLLEKELFSAFNKYLIKNLNKFEKKVFPFLNKKIKYSEIAEILNVSSKKIDNTVQGIRKKIKKFNNSLH